jgi:hypothetical protein
MGTFAASVHVRASRSETTVAIDAFEPDATFSTGSRAGWTSVHDDDLAFAALAEPLARALSKHLKTRAVGFAVHDGDTLWCGVFDSGRQVATLTLRVGRAPRPRPTGWKSLGVPIETLVASSDDLFEVATALARALAVPSHAVLADAPPHPTARRGRTTTTTPDPTLAADWSALEREARARGVSVPSLEIYLRLQKALGQPHEPRQAIALMRRHLEQAAQRLSARSD